jgi:hypothetical protein
VEAAASETHLRTDDPINKPVLAGDSARPEPCETMFEHLRLADAASWVPARFEAELDDPRRNTRFRPHPMCQVY